MPRRNICENPTGIRARTNGVGETANIHINKDAGFWCINAENVAECADFEVCRKSSYFSLSKIRGQNVVCLGFKLLNDLRFNGAALNTKPLNATTPVTPGLDGTTMNGTKRTNVCGCLTDKSSNFSNRTVTEEPAPTQLLPKLE